MSSSRSSVKLHFEIHLLIPVVVKRIDTLSNVQYPRSYFLQVISEKWPELLMIVVK